MVPVPVSVFACRLQQKGLANFIIIVKNTNTNTNKAFFRIREKEFRIRTQIEQNIMIHHTTKNFSKSSQNKWQKCKNTWRTTFLVTLFL